jgi:hypothetical protein
MAISGGRGSQGYGKHIELLAARMMNRIASQGRGAFTMERVFNGYNRSTDGPSGRIQLVQANYQVLDGQGASVPTTDPYPNTPTG